MGAGFRRRAAPDAALARRLAGGGGLLGAQPGRIR